MLRLNNDSNTIILLRADHLCNTCNGLATTFLLRCPNNLGSATRTCACNLGKSAEYFDADSLQKLLLDGLESYTGDEQVNEHRRIENACKAHIPEQFSWVFERGANVTDAIVLKCAVAAFTMRLKHSPNVWAKIKPISSSQQILTEYDDTPCIDCGHECGAHDLRGYCTASSCRKFCRSM